MGYWKNKLLPKIKKVFGPKKPSETTEEVKVGEEKKKEIEKVDESIPPPAAVVEEAPKA
ncbi:hypothetical protein DsansV1_C23g0179271 [Dioscorea sansibarensis]